MVESRWEFAEALREVIAKPECVREMSEAMLAHRKEIRNSVKVEKLLGVFRKCIKCGKV